MGRAARLFLAVGLAATAGSAQDAPAARPYVILRRFVCATTGTGAEALAADLEEARDIFAACGLDVRAGAARTIASDYGSRAACQLGDDRNLKALTPDQVGLFTKYAAGAPADGVRVFYLSWRTGPHGATTSGTSFPAAYVRTEKGDAEEARRAVGAVVVFDRARRYSGSRFVLAHELGHILLDDGAHRADRSNLMHGWNGGRRLDKAQCLTIRASPFVRRD